MNRLGLFRPGAWRRQAFRGCSGRKRPTPSRERPKRRLFRRHDKGFPHEHLPRSSRRRHCLTQLYYLLHFGPSSKYGAAVQEDPENGRFHAAQKLKATTVCSSVTADGVEARWHQLLEDSKAPLAANFRRTISGVVAPDEENSASRTRSQ